MEAKKIVVEKVSISIDKKFDVGGGFIAISVRPDEGEKWTLEDVSKINVVVLKEIMKANLKNAVLSGIISKEKFVEEKERVNRNLKIIEKE